MARRYKKSLDDLPVARLPDWALLQQVEELLRPYAPLGAGDLIFGADDSRGSYDAETIEELRAEADRQEEPPNNITISLGGNRSVYLRLWKESSYGFVIGDDDEAFVNHVSTRMRELFKKAAAKPEPKQPDPGKPSLPELQPQPPFWKQHAAQFITGVLVLVAGGAILYLFGIQT